MFRFAQEDRKMRSTAESSSANGDHLAVRLIIVSKIVLSRFAFDNVEKELLQLLIARTGPQRFHDVKLQIASQARTQFPVAGETKFVAALAEMQVGHRSDKTDPLFAARDLVVSGWPVCSEFRFRDQTSVNRFD